MSSDSERRKKRYAQDPGYRERTLAYNNTWKAAHHDQVNETRRRKYAHKPPGRLKYKYGITEDEYEAMLARQGGTWAICKTCPPGQKLCVDHCHLCNKIRRLLCTGCNLGLGHYKDNPQLTQAATDYLKEFRCEFCCPAVPLPRERGRGTGRNSARDPVSSPTLPAPDGPGRRRKAEPPE